MGSNLSPLLRDLGAILAVGVASLVVGAGLGTGLGKLSEGGDSSSTLPASAADVSPDPTGASGPTSAGRSAIQETEPQPPKIRVLSSTFAPATTPRGRERRRARLTVRLRVTAREDDATLGNVRLVSGDERRGADPNATEAAGGLLEVIPAGESATGALRFETAGVLTDRLANEGRAILRIGDRSLSLRLTPPRDPLSPPQP